MPNVKRNSKLIATLLTLTLLLTGCPEIPDIAKFTEQSAEMTRGIRTGVKDTEGRIRAASERGDLYSSATIGKLKKSLKDYQTALKPTVAALDALDGYLEALNTLSQASEKSGENAAAAVTAVTSLVTAVSGFTFAGPVVNVATGLLKLEEDFRLAKDFRKRVTLAAQIVEGVHPRMENGKPVKDKRGQVIYDRNCKEDSGERIFEAAKRIKEMAGTAPEVVTEKQAAELAPLPPDQQRALLIKWRKVTEEQAAELKTLKPNERRQKLWEWGHLQKAQYDQIASLEADIEGLGCGVVDLLKFNVRDLKAINISVSRSMFDGARDKNRTVLGFYESIVSTDRRIQNELETILNYRGLAAFIRESEANDADPDDILDMKRRLKEQLHHLLTTDGPLRLAILADIARCGARCGKMKEFLETKTCSGPDSSPGCDPQVLDGIIASIEKPQFDHANGLIEERVELRAAGLYEQNTKYLEDLERITPAHTAVMTELNGIKSKGNQIDALLDSSLSALDAWAETHANLRVAVNTKKTLTVSRLASKVREIWGIINPEAE